MTRRWAGIERDAARLVASSVGFAFLIGGLAMLIVPGPGILAATIGLGILATQFSWARRLFERVEGSARSALADITTNGRARALLALAGLAMILGGAAAALALPSWRAVGVVLGISGLFNCAIMLPPVQARLRTELA